MVAMGVQGGVETVITTKEFAGEGEREDMRKIWNSLSREMFMYSKYMYMYHVVAGSEHEGQEFFYKSDGEEEWAKLEAALDMSSDKGTGLRMSDEDIEEGQVDEEEDEEEVDGEEEQGYEEDEEEEEDEEKDVEDGEDENEQNDQ